MNKYTPVIGLEIHVELKTKSKMFCQCSADYFGKTPNTNTCPVCLGMPGALPVPNRTAIEWAIKIGQALNCTINKHSKFDRKHYFYPDLPKAYQISQYDEPLAVSGYLEIRSKNNTTPPPDKSGDTPPYKGGELQNKALLLTKEESSKREVVKQFNITRVHLEEDTGKLTHTGKDTLVDFNRSSVPLVEIVTEPDFDNAEDVKLFLEELHTIIRYLDVSDANMEEGSMRIEPNISLQLKMKNEKLKIKKNNLPNYKVEVKNINSFNFAKRAIEYELKRQAKILDKGETPTQETRGYNEDKGITYAQRAKEEAQDYRYFPEPDIPPMEFGDKELEKIQSTIPELPAQKRARYIKDYGLKENDARLLSRHHATAHYYEGVISKFNPPIRRVNVQSEKLQFNIQNFEIHIAHAIINKKISIDLTPDEFAKKFIEMAKPVEVDESKLTQVIDGVLTNNPKQVAQYKAGKTGLMGFFIGQVMGQMKGKADPQAVRTLLEEKM